MCLIHTCNQSKTLVRYPVAKITESTGTTLSSTSSTLFLKNLLTAGTILISPDLILLRAPMSRTGVLPSVFFNANGPLLGLFRPKLSVLPRTSHVKKRTILSTSQRGKHCISKTPVSNVDLPKISLGNT